MHSFRDGAIKTAGLLPLFIAFSLQDGAAAMQRRERAKALPRCRLRPPPQSIHSSLRK
jgi:hypothetical protein